ncbi:MAG: lasso peptide biosynthesis B2 protein [Acidimicrobiia bacterium]
MTAAVAAIARPRRPPAEVRLGAEIAWTTLRVRRLVHRNDLPTALDRCRAAVPQQAPVPSRDEVVRISRAVRRTVGMLPGDSRGLVASLVLIAVLARRGVDASLVMGVRRGKEVGTHAWVEIGGFPGPRAAKERFAQLVAL